VCKILRHTSIALEKLVKFFKGLLFCRAMYIKILALNYRKLLCWEMSQVLCLSTWPELYGDEHNFNTALFSSSFWMHRQTPNAVLWFCCHLKLPSDTALCCWWTFFRHIAYAVYNVLFQHNTIYIRPNNYKSYLH